ncbi:uncharacterized protein LOC143731258 [Siphateles boraxobius]|uniref:uncharacterized protein LOC143731258 n=1 Tax=Siphateles boraxobius TaxID=180520 RepID=UPI0040644ECF
MKPSYEDEEQEHKAGTGRRNTNTDDIKQRSDKDWRTAVSISRLVRLIADGEVDEDQLKWIRAVLLLGSYTAMVVYLGFKAVVIFFGKRKGKCCYYTNALFTVIAGAVVNVFGFSRKQVAAKVMMVYQKTDDCEEIMKMDMEYERKTTFSKGRPCNRKTGIFVLLGTVCMIIFLIMTSVIFFHQQRTFSVLESWMNIHSSNQTSFKSQEKNIETLMTNLASSLSSITSKQEENQQKLESLSSSMSILKSSVSDLTSSVASLSSQLSVTMRQQDMKSLTDSLNSAVSTLTSKLTDAVKTQDQKQTDTERSLDSLKSSIQSDQQNKQRDFESLSSSLSVLKSSVSDLTSSVASLSSKQQISEERVMNALKDLQSNMRNKTADVPVTCKSGWISYKSSCFLFSNNKLSWTEARDYCKAQGTLLLKIEEDDEEWAFLNKHTIPEHYWVGLTDQNTGQWRWADDTPYTMNKERWHPGQPDDWKEHGLGDEGEDCGHFRNNGKLNDSHCSSKMRFICRV